MTHPPEPTPEQCTKKEKVAAFGGQPAFAIWYPQMGGYVGKAVVVKESDDPESCFGVYVWHDGAFPFNEEYGHNPAYLHHCSALQFIDFGESVVEKQKEYFK